MPDAEEFFQAWAEQKDTKEFAEFLPVRNERWTPSSVRMERQQTVSN